MSIFAARYARAFADAVQDAKLDTADVSRQLADFSFAWNESKELREVFENPAFSLAQKIAVLDKLNARIGLAGPVRNFIAVLIEHDRIAALHDVLAEYAQEIDRRQGIAEVEVVTARPLDEAERQRLEGQVAQLAGSRVRARFTEDGALLGGAVVRIGSTVYDGSVRGRLDRLKEQLIAG